MHASHHSLRALGAWGLGLGLLACAPLTQAPAATAFAPTVSSIRGPADGLICGVLGDPDVLASVPTAGLGRIGRLQMQQVLGRCDPDEAAVAAFPAPSHHWIDSAEGVVETHTDIATR